jgi:hypothetical protein
MGLVAAETGRAGRRGPAGHVRRGPLAG